MGGFLYHISFLLTNYFDYPVATSTEEIHATELEFPTVTICNLNNVKKSKFEAYLLVRTRPSKQSMHCGTIIRGICGIWWIFSSVPHDGE